MALGAWTFDATSTGTVAPLGTKHYREMNSDSGEATMSEDASEARRVFLTDWNQRTDFMTDCLGSATIAGGGLLNRVLPEVHPDYAQFWANSCRVSAVGVGSVDGLKSNWTLAKIETGFRPTDYAVVDDETKVDELDRFVSRRTIPKGDYLQLSINAFKWFSRPPIAGVKQPLGATPGIIVPTTTFEYTWWMVPTKDADGGDRNKPFRCPLESRILTLLGKTNNAPFDQIHPRGSILFTAAEAEQSRPRLTDGKRFWKIRYFFENKNYGAGVAGDAEVAGVNYLFDPTTLAWDLVTLNGGLGGARLYAPGNLGDLFLIP